MKVKPRKVTYRIHQSRFIDVEVSEEKGFDMPETLSECIAMNDEIQGNPTVYIVSINQWEADENDVQDIEWHD